MPNLAMPGGSEFYERNKKYVKPGVKDFFTQLSPGTEQQFRQWVSHNKVPYDTAQPYWAEHNRDYDMRGFYKGLMEGDPHAVSGINPIDKKPHFTDYWKTPYHESFSRESRLATPDAPSWVMDRRLLDKYSNVFFDVGKGD